MDESCSKHITDDTGTKFRTDNLRDVGGCTKTMRRVGECGVDIAGSDNNYLGLAAYTVTNNEKGANIRAANTEM